MGQLVYLLLLNHGVISRGKLVGSITVSHYRCGDYWV